MNSTRPRFFGLPVGLISWAGEREWCLFVRLIVEVRGATRFNRDAFPRLKGQPSRYAICPIARRSSMMHNGNDEDFCVARPKYHAKGKAFHESAAGVVG